MRAWCDKLRWVLTSDWSSPLARARAFWHYLVRRYPYEICRHCGRPVAVVWLAPDPLWVYVMGGANGVSCVPCFTRRAEADGLWLTWTPTWVAERGVIVPGWPEEEGMRTVKSRWGAG